MNLLIFIQALCTVSIGLMAGIYLIFSNTIMLSLKAFDNSAMVMVRINKIILNPIFKFIFFFSAVSSGYLAFLGEDLHVMYRVGCLIFFINTFLVTLFKNVPLNNKLLEAIEYDNKTIDEVWNMYLVSWVKWNHVRTVSALLASCLVCFSPYL